MKNKERIPVYVYAKDGKTICICKRTRKKCKRTCCEEDFVVRDKFIGWQGTMKRDRFGK